MTEHEEDLGEKIIAAIDANDPVLLESLFRGGEFILYQQIDTETGSIDEDDEGNFSVVLAELEDSVAVVCFTSSEIADNFVQTQVTDLPEGAVLPSVMVDGESLLEGLPEDCGLLLNPASERECFFPPGSFDPEDGDSSDESDSDLEA